MSEPKDNESFPPPTADSRPQAQPQQPTPPPPAGYAPAAVKEKGGFKRGFGKGFGGGLGFALGAGVILTILSIISALSMVGTIAAMGSQTTGSTALETVWGDEGASGTLRAIDVAGVIMAEPSDGGGLGGGVYGYEIAEQIDELTKDDSSGLLLLVNTPGGSIPGSKAMADAVTRYKERTGQPVLVHISSMSASGGVYSTTTADEIVADHGALVGSVGVISGPFQQYSNVTAIGDTLLQAGVTAEQITQEYLSAGTGKAFGDPFNPMDPKSREQWLAGINREYDNFVKQVVDNRPIDENKLRNEYGASLFDSATAKEYGYVDDVMGRPEFFKHAAETAGLDPEDTKVEKYSMPGDFMSSLLGLERINGQAPVVEQGEGVTPSVSPAICSPTRILAYAGSVSSFCG